MKTRVDLAIQQDGTGMAESNGLYNQGGLTDLGEQVVKAKLAELGLTFLGQRHKL